MRNETRRSPTGDARQRDAERTRRAILASATQEFAAYGFAGARVSRIADRAGVNKQLISYYYGGKDGLRDAVISSWQVRAPALYPAGAPIAEVVGNFVRANTDNPSMTRLLAWESIGDFGDISPEFLAARQGWMQRLIDDLSGQQKTGEMPAGVDPRALALVLFAAAAAPVIYSPIAEAMGIADPLSQETGEWYAQELGKIVRALGTPPDVRDG